MELQSKADFLRSRPDFDTAEVIAISASQLSQFPHPGSQTELPPSQFCITSSHPSQDFIGDSQPKASPVAAESQGTSRNPRISQRTTIPDSQDFSTDFTQESIPSRQPGIVLGSFETISFSTYRHPEGEHPEAGNLEVGAQQGQYPESENLVPVRPTSSFDGFLTQLDFGVSDFDSTGHSSPRPESEGVGVTQGEQQSINLAEQNHLEDSEQPAQIVPPLPGQVPPFQTQNEQDFFSASEGYDFVPDTARRGSSRSRQSQSQQMVDVPSAAQ